MENVPLWHERDIAHSSVERITIPDSTILADYGLAKFNELLSGLVIDKRQMLKNIYFRGGIVFSQRLLLKLTAKIGSREDAYLIVQRNAMKAHDTDGSFRECISADPDVTKHLSVDEIEELFTLDYYLKNAKQIVERVLKT